MRLQIKHDPETRARLRRQLPSNIFVQFLAGPRDLRDGLLGWMLRVIAWISLIIGPVLLLVFFQLQFLPYHNPVVTWWQRIAVLLDLVLLWILWPTVACGAGLRWHEFSWVKTAGLLILSGVPTLLVFTIATFPGEWLDDTIPPMRLIPTSWSTIEWDAPNQFLVADEAGIIPWKPVNPYR